MTRQPICSSAMAHPSFAVSVYQLSPCAVKGFPRRYPQNKITPALYFPYSLCYNFQ